MKKLRLILIAIVTILVVSIAVFTNVVSALEVHLNEITPSNVKFSGEWIKTYAFSSNGNMVNWNNVYCVHLGAIQNGGYYKIRTEINIDGNSATIKPYKNNGEEDKDVTPFECEGEYNNLLAAILCEGELGYGRPHFFNDSQVALYKYWNTWVDEIAKASGRKFPFNLKDFPYNDAIKTEYKDSAFVHELYDVEGIFNFYKDKASEKNYNVKIYYFEVVIGDASQELILVERGTPTDKNMNIPVEKVWNDGGNTSARPESITVELLANKESMNPPKTITLSAPEWKGKFEGLKLTDGAGNHIEYSIKEINTPPGYVSKTEHANNKFTITNTLLTDVKVIKKWDDQEDLDGYRPGSVTVELYAGDYKIAEKTLDENWEATFEKLNKYDKAGNEINYTVREKQEVTHYTPNYNSETKDGYIEWTIINKHTPKYDGYIEVSGRVWKDVNNGKGNDIDGIFKDNDDTLEGIIVKIKDKDGNPITSSYYSGTGDNITYCGKDYAETAKDGTYTIRVNYDNSKNVYKLYDDADTVNKKLEEAYVEFEYDGIKYTTVAPNAGDNNSKATENADRRNVIDTNYSTVNANTKHPDTLKYEDKSITAKTEKMNNYGHSDENREVVLKYCNGNGSYISTNPNGAWKEVISKQGGLACNSGTGHDLRKHEITVTKITNINIGLFEREQPNISLFSDIRKVEIEMNKQRYTYLYGHRSSLYTPGKDDYIKTKFQDKKTYDYRTPVNPADIAHLNEINKNAMEVYVTYEITIGNISDTLKVLVNNISNAYDSNYKIKYSDGDDSTERYHITYGTMDKKGNITGTALQDNQISAPANKNGCSEITLDLRNFKIELNAQEESEYKIYIRYQINQEQLPDLFKDISPLNNATEILSFTTKYGEKTVYAEQHSGERAGKLYAGYDYNSHPGNAEFFINDKGRLEATKPEIDTDIAPAFALCKDTKLKTLSGTVWEDADVNLKDTERLGNGHHEDSEKDVQNVKIELYNLDGTIAKLYNEETQKLDRDAIIYSGSDGSYKIDGVVTNEYYVKYTYGNDTTKLEHEATTIDGGETNINARNYKSTIIKEDSIKNILNKDYKNFSPEEKMWHITHQPGYSVAVDNMEERLKIEDLTYNNFDNPLNMTSYTKPFATQVEFEATGISQVIASEQELESKVIAGNINVSKELKDFDFGIAERPREDIYTQKTITYFKITLANGQILTEGNPSESNSIPYTKAMGFRQKIDSGEDARKALEKQLLVEMDTELLQGAKLEAQYAVTITNNSEKDYDYGNKDDADYKNEFEANKAEYDKFITRNSKANYYYYGDSNGLNEIKAVIKFVDYLNDGIDYIDNSAWTTTDVSELVSEDVKNELSKNICKTFTNKDQVVTLANGASSDPIYMIVNKVLANKEENVYSNSVEILSIDGKIARTIQGTDDGRQIEKSYKPGNYVPSSSSNTNEQDDDRVKITITPPTGATNYIITYVIATLVGLVIVSLGVIFIKKKVLTK